MTHEYYEVLIEKKQEGSRLDAVLSQLLESVSRSYLQKLIADGQVRVNGVLESSKKYKVKDGDRIVIDIPEPVSIEILPENLPLEIIYEDEDLLVIHKAKGMVVHPAAGNHTGTLVNAVLYHCKDLSDINGVIRPGIVHRIDKDTSGLLMIAKNNLAHSSLALQLKEHSITRVYHAIVYSSFKEDSGTINAPIGRDHNNRLKMAVLKEGSREAITHYKVLERLGNFTYIEARLETGRTHQIRVHMAYVNHPLVGDHLYGPSKIIQGVNSQLLHAKTLGFHHPRSGIYMEFDCPLPAEFEKFLAWNRSKR
jgi:23S rRNA pseudouridine1911/1915/1917 synthase